MYRSDNGLRFSPSDLSLFLESEFASWMDRLSLEQQDLSVAVSERDPSGLGLISCQADEPSEEDAIFQRRGLDHEKRTLGQFRQAGRTVVEIGPGTLEQQRLRTEKAMRDGADVIYQARLDHATLGGYADFLVRCEGDSALGNYHYEVWDTKLAKSPKPYFVIQLCAYTEMLAHLQGRRPERLVVVLGDGVECPLAVDKFVYYFRELRRQFEAYHDGFSRDAMPHPGLSANHGKWGQFASEFLVASDHLSGVAGITCGQIKKLEAAGITTIAALATTAENELPRLPVDILARLKRQAQLVVASRGQEKPVYELIPSESREAASWLGLVATGIAERRVL